MYTLMFMVFNANFNNISVISWQSDLLVEEVVVPGENHSLSQVTEKTLSHNVVPSTPRHKWGLIAQVVEDLTTIRSWPQWPHNIIYQGYLFLVVIWLSIYIYNQTCFRSVNNRTLKADNI